MRLVLAAGQGTGDRGPWCHRQARYDHALGWLGSGPAPGRAVTADPAVLAARTIAGVDIGAARRAAADFLSALGIDVDREEMRETPGRMARAYAELFDARPLRLTTFANDEGYDELVLARRQDHYVYFAGHAAGRPAQPGGVLRPGWRGALKDGAPNSGCAPRKDHDHDRSTR